MSDIVRVCKVCGPLTLNETYHRPPTHMYECQKCRVAYSIEYKRRNAEKSKAWDKQDRIKNRERYNAYTKKCKDKNRGKVHGSDIKRLYGVTAEQYEAMFVAQKGVCMICSKPETRKSRTPGKICRLAIDHDHKTGKIRDLLCSDCNTGIGKLKDSPFLIEKAIAYLRKHGKHDNETSS